MAVAPLYFFDRALLKLTDGTIDLDTTTIKAVLTTSTQALTRTFTGTSGDARYSDLTNELTTANGYTAGGTTITGVLLTRPSANVVKFSSSNISWTLTGSITAKYLVFYASSATNQDLLMVCDLDDTGSSLTATAGSLVIAPDSTSGWAKLQQ
jgi:hypothetical protein